jgi:hypothetical protein
MPLPRRLLFASIAFAMLAFLVTVGERRPIEPTSGAYAPSVRAFAALAAFGMCVAWPLWRIAMPPAGWDRRRAALDLATLLIAFQAAFWPLHLVSGWTLAGAAAVDAVACGWAAAAGAIVALASRRRIGAVTAGVAVLCVAAAGVALDGLRAPWPWAALAGPFAAILEASARRGTGPVAAIAAWPWAVAFALWALALRPGSRRPGEVAGPAGIR